MKDIVKTPGIALLGLALLASTPGFAKDESSLPAEPQAKSAATESVQSQVDKAANKKATEKRKQLIEEASAAIRETRNALKALEAGKRDEALSALEKVTGKLELIIARDPELALAPVNVEVTTIDLLANVDTVKAMIHDAEDYLEDGEIQKARPIVSNLASEIIFSTVQIPLATYPEAIKAITPLIDAGKIEAAKTGLQAALDTLVITDEVIPLPKLRAMQLLKNAEALAENQQRTEKDNATLKDLLAEARNQLKLAEVLGYGDQKAFKPIYRQLDEIEKKTAGGKAGKGWFDKVKKSLSDLF